MDQGLADGAEGAQGHGGALALLRALLLDNCPLAASLGAIDAPETFITAAVEVAAAHGIAVSAGELGGALRPDPLGIGRFAPAPLTLDRWPGQGWAPARSAPTGGAPAVDWIWMRGQALADPFYENSVRRAWGRPLNLLMRSRTGFEQLIAGAAEHDIAPPDGFIFHMSRCGSTLLSQMLAQLPNHTVVSEPEPLDAVVQWAALADDRKAGVMGLRAIVKALARCRSSAGGRVFVKLDAWHTLALPLFRQAFPDVPWLFLYREPLEVLVSQMRAPGVHAVPGVLPDQVLGIEGGSMMPQEEYCARALGRICEAVIDNWPLGAGLLVNYSELLSDGLMRAATHFGFVPGPADAAAMASAAERHAKTGEPFEEDGPAKRSHVSAAVGKAVECHLRSSFDRIEQLRLG